MRKCKRAFGLALLGLFAFFGASACAGGSGGQTPRYAAEAAEASSSAEGGSGGGDFAEEALRWVGDKVVPIVGSSAVVTFVGMATSIVTAIAKRKGDKKNALLIQAQDAKIALFESLEAERSKREEERARREEEMKTAYVEALGKSTALLEEAAKQAKAAAGSVAEQGEALRKVARMRDSIDASCRLIAKSMALSEVAVRSGMAADAKRIAESVRGMAEDGERSDG